MDTTMQYIRFSHQYEPYKRDQFVWFDIDNKQYQFWVVRQYELIDFIQQHKEIAKECCQGNSDFCEFGSCINNFRKNTRTFTTREFDKECYCDAFECFEPSQQAYQEVVQLMNELKLHCSFYTPEVDVFIEQQK